jgi:surface antigen
VRLLRRALVLLCAVLALSAATVAPASATGDDYPWRTDLTATADQYGFTKGQCVSFVAWRLAQRSHALDNRIERWGDAHDWDNAARRLGHDIGSRPVVGAVAHWNAGERGAYYGHGATWPNGTMWAGAYGHVAYVERVHADGSATVSHYNMNGMHAFSTTRLKAPRYLYVGVPAPRS